MEGISNLMEGISEEIFIETLRHFALLLDFCHLLDGKLSLNN